MDKANVVYPYTGMLFNNKKELERLCEICGVGVEEKEMTLRGSNTQQDFSGQHLDRVL